MPSAVPRADRRTGRRQPAVRPRVAEDSGPSACGPASNPARRCRRGQAYSSRANRSYLRKRSIKAVIPEKKDQAANRKKKGRRGGSPTRHNSDLYKERNTVERLINKLKAWRGIATRYDKSPESYLAGLHLRASMIWINDLLKATG